jgi:hypothetical protein
VGAAKWETIQFIIKGAREAVAAHEAARDTGDLEHVLTALGRVKHGLGAYDRASELAAKGKAR